MHRPTSQAARIANRPPPPSKDLAVAGLARITIRRLPAESAGAARLRVIALGYEWTRGIVGTRHENPYQVGDRQWVFVYRPASSTDTTPLAQVKVPSGRDRLPDGSAA